MKEILLTQNQIALVDDEDFERVNQFRWYAEWISSTKSFYAMRADYSGDIRVIVSMSRFIVHCSESMMVDHKNHNTLDNQKYNLRICTQNQNNQNARKRSGTASRYKGVCWTKMRNKWFAQIGLRDIFDQRYNKFLGYFNIEEEAALAYDEAARYYFEEFAYLNFPTRPTDG